MVNLSRAITYLRKFQAGNRKTTATMLMAVMLLGTFFSYLWGNLGNIPTAQASVNTWQKGVSLYPQANNDFAGNAFKQSLANAASINANMATFIVPYYQTYENSTDIQSGWNTPTDQSLSRGIAYAHSLGMQTAIKIHISPYFGDSWSAYINPPDRAGWFANYGAVLNHYAAFGATNHVEQFVIGNELTDMTSAKVDPANTGYWKAMIAQVRSVYHGSLTYNANWGGDGVTEEKSNIGFWNDLDIIGISGYFNLSSDRQAAWQQWNSTAIAPLAQKYGKPVVFTEVGYRSVDGATEQPWNYALSGSANEQEQADNYNALFSYWNDFSYMHGINIWDWETTPNAGGPGNTHFTVQNKKAQAVVKNWFGNQTATAPAAVNDTTVPAAPTSTPTTANPTNDNYDADLQIWWPTDNAELSGIQQIKGILNNHDLASYKMFWQVDGGTWNEMTNATTTEGAHKESTIDVSGWNWQPTGHYTITLIVQDSSGVTKTQKSVVVTVK